MQNQTIGLFVISIEKEAISQINANHKMLGRSEYLIEIRRIKITYLFSSYLLQFLKLLLFLLNRGWASNDTDTHFWFDQYPFLYLNVMNMMNNVNVCYVCFYLDLFM